jgi:hypothetical protein
LGGEFGQIQVKLALCNFVMVEVVCSTLLLSLVYEQNHSQQIGSKLFVADCFSSKCERVSKKQISVARNFDCVLDSVDPSARDGNTNYMLIVAFAETLFKL